MQHRKEKDGMHIILDEGEDERTVLRAMIKAAYKCSYEEQGASSSLAWDDLPDAKAEPYLGGKDHDGREHAVYAWVMDGATHGEMRLARFVVDRFADRHFLIDLMEFEKGVVHYHSIESLLGIAKRMLSGEYGQFKTDDLDRRLAAYGIVRADKEDDWKVRRRAFLEVWPKAPVEALEFLYGCPSDKLSKTDKAEIHGLMSVGLAAPDALKTFIASLPYDPQRRRGDQAAFLSIFG